jgi:hypothetical protein
MAKWTQDKVLSVIGEARNAGYDAAVHKLFELRQAGPKYNVISGDTVVGQLLDPCGMAWLKIPARGKFYILAKALSQHPAFRFSCRRGYYGGGELNIFDSTMRQEMAVNVAAAKAQAEILKTYGIEAHVVSRID